MTPAPPVARPAAQRWRAAWARLSLRARIVGLFVVLAMGTSAFFMQGLQQAFRGGWQDYGRVLIADYADRLVADLGTPPDPARAQALVDRLPIAIRIDGPSVHWPPGEPPLERMRPRRGERVDADDADRADRPDRPRHGPGRRYLVERTLSDGHVVRIGLADAWRIERPRHLGLGALLGLLLLTLVAYALVRRWLRPLDDIRRGAIRYGHGDFSRPIPADTRDELGVLAGQINTMAGRLKARADDQHALLLAISHELRSPLTRARINADLLPDTPDAQPARDALLRDLGEMRDLIADLLESERLAAGAAALQTVPTDLAALVRETVAERLGATPGAAVELRLDALEPPLAVDPARLRLVVRNLLDNAWRHGASTVPPVVSVTRGSGSTAGAIVLSVRDHGPGVPPEQLDRLAEAFYRPDDARQRTTGGVGLGLYLCRRVAEAHGGRLGVRRAEPGLEVWITLPVTPAHGTPP